MARPLKAGLDYFSHDTEAHADQKIQSLMALYGAKGYTFYFIMLEKVFRSENGKVPAGKPVEKAGLSRSMCLNIKEYEKILETSLEVGLFDKVTYEAEQNITSNGVQKRLNKIKADRERERIRKEQYLKEKEKEKEKTKTGKPPENPRKTKKGLATPIPEGFSISAEIKEWAEKEGHTQLEKRLEHFKDWAKGGKDGIKKYVDWDATFRNAIRGDYAHLNGNGNGQHPEPEPKKKEPTVLEKIQAEKKRLEAEAAHD